MNAAIITARTGSKSILNKNVFVVSGGPLVYYPIRAALDAQKIDKIYISTDGEEIAEVARKYDVTVIWRPEELCGDHVNHGDVIKHAVEWVDEQEKDLDKIVLLLGNTVMIDGQLVDDTLHLLDSREDLDSCMTVWEAADDHPFRAMEINENGLLQPYDDPERKVSTERQSYKKAYYYDQGVWAFRKYTVHSHDGPNPWWWMGKRCLPVIRTWVTGRDIHTYFDVGIAEWWLQNQAEIQERLKKSV